MRVITIIILALTFCVQVGRANGVWSSYVQTNRYDFIVTDAELAKAPAWKQTEDCPPLAPRAALRLARARLEQLVSDSKDWTLDSLRLETVGGDHWIYLAVFDAPTPGGILNGLPVTMTIPVLMSGVAIKPKISPWPQ